MNQFRQFEGLKKTPSPINLLGKKLKVVENVCTVTPDIVKQYYYFILLWSQTKHHFHFNANNVMPETQTTRGGAGYSGSVSQQRIIPLCYWKR